MPSASRWTPALIQQLRDLWPTDATTGEIGRLTGLGKSAVIGKARRLRLGDKPGGGNAQLRGSQRWASEQKAKRLAAAGLAAPATFAPPPVPTAPARFTVSAMPPPSSRTANAGLRGGELSAQAAREAQRRAERPPAHHNAGPLHYAANLGCQWPTGEAKRPGIAFECAAPRITDRPYCADHCAVAYVALRRAEAA